MKAIKVFILLMSWMLLGLVAQAQEVDLKKSEFSWKGTKVTGEHVGKVSLKSAQVTSKGDEVTGGEFVIDMSTMTVTDLEGEWAQKFIDHIKSADFFDIAKHPEAKLVLTSVKDGEYKGNLTIKSKTNPVTFKAKREGKTYSGVLSFNRTKFDMIYGSGSIVKGLGDKMIHDEVLVNFKLVLK